jgi:hypothetical protein
MLDRYAGQLDGTHISLAELLPDLRQGIIIRNRLNRDAINFGNAFFSFLDAFSQKVLISLS